MFKKSSRNEKKQSDIGNNGSSTTTITKKTNTKNGSTQISSTTTVSHTVRQMSVTETKIETAHIASGIENISFKRSPLTSPLTRSFGTSIFDVPQTDAKPFQSTAGRPSLTSYPSSPPSFTRQTPTYSSYRSNNVSTARASFFASPPALAHSATTSGFGKQTPPSNSFGVGIGASTQSLPTTREAAARSPIVPTYDTGGKKRGKLLLINNINFKDAEERKGAKKDADDLKAMFRAMGFNTDESYNNLKASDMHNRIKKFRNDSSLKNYDIAIVIVMSHGNNLGKDGKKVGGGYTEIFGTDDKGLPVDQILDEFSGDNCKQLKGKPKIFIFQCCRGQQDEICKDVAPMKTVIKEHADMLIAFSTLPGFSSNRDPVKGTWYIQSICEIFKRHGKDFDIETLLKIVDDELGKKHPTYKQTSTYESRGFKRCFLNPK